MLSFLLLFYWNFWKFLCKYLIIRQLKISPNFSKLTRLSKNEKTAKDNMITVLRCYFLPHDFQKILHDFQKILHEFSSKTVVFFIKLVHASWCLFFSQVFAEQSLRSDSNYAKRPNLLTQQAWNTDVQGVWDGLGVSQTGTPSKSLCK